MKRLITLFVISLAFAFSAGSLLAQGDETGVDVHGWNIIGKADIIPYLDGRDFDNDTFAPTYTSAELRAGVAKEVNEHLDFRIEFHNSFIFGETGNIMDHGSQVGMVQGYANFKNIFDVPLAVKIGRFHIKYGDGRLFDKSSWSYTERSFDGTMISYAPEGTKIDLLLSTISTPINFQPSAASASKVLHGADYADVGLFGLFVTQEIADNSDLTVLLYLEDNPAKVGVENEKALERFTGGVDYVGKYDELEIKAMFAYQFGTIEGTDIGAYMANLDAKYWVSETIAPFIGVEILSGQDQEDSETFGLFDNTYGGKHAYFGYMDYFVNAGTSAATGGLGVNGIYIGAQYSSPDKKWMAKAKLHHFMTNQTSAKDLDTWGQEIDLQLRYNLAKGIFVEWGGGVFIADELMQDFWAGNEDPAFMSYFRTLIEL